MLLRQISIEIRKTASHPALWIGLGALLVLIGLLTVVHHSQMKYGFIPFEAGLENDLLAGISLFRWIGGFIYAVSASVIIAYDYPDLRLWLTRGLSRSDLLLARLAVILLICGLLICISVVATLGFAAFSRQLFFGSVAGPTLDLQAMGQILLRTFWSSLPYLCLTVMLAVASRSAILAASAMIFYVNVLEKLLLSVRNRYPLLTRYLPGELAVILQSRNPSLDLSASPSIFISGGLTETQAILAIALLSGIFIAISMLIFSHQDLGG